MTLLAEATLSRLQVTFESIRKILVSIWTAGTTVLEIHHWVRALGQLKARHFSQPLSLEVAAGVNMKRCPWIYAC